MEVTLSNKKKMLRTMFCSFFVMTFLGLRIGFLQFHDGEKLQILAYEQQVQQRTVSAKRGTIYDSTGKYILAVSSTAYQITINPTNITKENKEKVARALSDIFELDYEKVLKKVSKKSSIETITKKVEEEKADELRKWMLENNIKTGINIDVDTKRYYPYSNLASQLIGFCGSDNQGLDGKYVAPIDGKSIKLSIDMTIQSIIEKHLEEACIDNKCTDGGNIVAMNPKTGDVLAMATYPSYNLNEPYTVNSEELKNNWENMEQKEKTKALQGMWRNKAISDTYEPGSVFKLITASAALDALNSDDNKDLTASFASLTENENYNTAFMNLDSGAADAIAVDIGVAKYQLSKREEGKYVIMDEPIQSEQYGIGFKKGNEELRDTVWAEVMKLYEAGEVEKLAEQYEVADMLCIGDDDAQETSEAEDTQAADDSEAEADAEAEETPAE